MVQAFTHLDSSKCFWAKIAVYRRCRVTEVTLGCGDMWSNFFKWRTFFSRKVLDQSYLLVYFCAMSFTRFYALPKVSDSIVHSIPTLWKKFAAQFVWTHPANVVSKKRKKKKQLLVWFESSNDKTNGVNVTSLKDQKFFFFFFLNCRHWRRYYIVFLTLARPPSKFKHSCQKECCVKVIKKYYNKLHNNIQWCSRRLVILKCNLTPNNFWRHISLP